jgi:dephospho-CoA kinase
MILVGLTGGIGAGKSTVSDMLRARGAVIVDADAATRVVQQPGSPVLEALAERFGADVIAGDGSLNRAAVAAIVFNDADALRDLNRIVHPAVGAEMNRQMMAQRETPTVVVLDVPLLTENPREGLQAIVVVDIDPELAVSRLVTFRGMTEDDARARIARQATREARLATATWVIDNGGSRDETEAQVDAVWIELQTLPQLPDDYQPVAPKPL